MNLKKEVNMSKFNNAYERLHYKWSYGGDGFVGLNDWFIDYNVAKQQDDWFTLNEEYTKLSKALDKAIELLDKNMLCEKCPFPHDTERCTVEGCKEYLKECLLNGN